MLEESTLSPRQSLKSEEYFFKARGKHKRATAFLTGKLTSSPFSITSPASVPNESEVPPARRVRELADVISKYGNDTFYTGIVKILVKKIKSWKHKGGILKEIKDLQTNVEQPVNFSGADYQKKQSVWYEVKLSLPDDMRFEIKLKIVGGGMCGQEKACEQAIARLLRTLGKLAADKTTQLNEEDSEDFPGIKRWLRQRSRPKERKKYGLKKARKATSWSKR
jgi:ribosomal protein S9